MSLFAAGARQSRRDPFDVLGAEQLPAVAGADHDSTGRLMNAPGAPALSARRSGMFANGGLRQPMGAMADLSGGYDPEQHMASVAAEEGLRRERGRERTRKIVGAIGDGMLAYSAGLGNQASMSILQGNMAMRREAAEAAQRQRQLEAEAEAKRYEPRSVGSNLVQLQQDGTYATLYNAPEPFEDYASSLGYQPGTPEYQEAVRNYRLGAWSDDAVEAKQGLTGYRFDRMGTLQDRRYDRMEELQDDRLAVIRRGQDITSADRRRGQDIVSRDRGADRIQRRDIASQTDKRVRDSAGFSGRGGGRGSRGGGAATARMVNPTTGQAIVLKGNRWVDERTGNPVN